ncbi:hypothetical protein B7Y94_00765 [Candidatus Saccharibacteria bacterium 32-49-12]|nr:MAG: hypothetical protein B7Y94_00765 [Candidatus Saccharibacteria bacterium 32-49-12]
MNKFSRLVLVAMAVSLTLILTVSQAGALDRLTPELTPEQHSKVVSNCYSIKTSLNQLRASDALLRVNRGQIYESISGKLMERFNYRASSNDFDTSGLLAMSNSYDTRLGYFRTHYDAYARQLDEAIKIDCTTKPDEFHQSVMLARDKRGLVRDDIKMLHAHIDDYRGEVVQIKQLLNKLEEGSDGR